MFIIIRCVRFGNHSTHIQTRINRYTQTPTYKHTETDDTHRHRVLNRQTYKSTWYKTQCKPYVECSPLGVSNTCTASGITWQQTRYPRMGQNKAYSSAWVKTRLTVPHGSKQGVQFRNGLKWCLANVSDLPFYSFFVTKRVSRMAFVLVPGAIPVPQLQVALGASCCCLLPDQTLQSAWGSGCRPGN